MSLIALTLMACGGGKVTIDGTLGEDPEDRPSPDTGSYAGDDTGDPGARDQDEDGHPAATDCDDLDPSIHPGADEICDGVDQDCDGVVDEDAIGAPTWYLDVDGDGFGAESLTACEAPSGTVAAGGDCDDAEPSVNPGEDEICGDGIDNNCDGGPGACRLAGLVSLADASAIIYGARPEDEIGLHATGVGDVTGDGRDDLLLGIPGSDERTTDAGLALVIAGPMSGDITTEDAVLRLQGSEVGDGAGHALAGAGYVNGDIVADLLVGAPWADGVGTDGGAVYLVYGGETGTTDLADAHATYLGETAGDEAGYAVLRIGDVDGDGTSEFAVGAPYASLPAREAGAVYVVSPDFAGTFNLSTADARLVGSEEREQAGRVLEAAGDLDGDGTADLLVGAPYHHGGSTGSNSGRVYIVFGTPEDGPLNESAQVINGEGEHAYVGMDIAALGDVNGDGQPDIALGSGNADSAGVDSGEVYVLYGPFDGDRSVLEADVVITGEQSFDFAGNALSAVSDYNEDGTNDFLIGAIGNDYGGATAGAAYLLYGPFDDSTELSRAEVKLYGTDDQIHSGAHLGAAGDVDGDGRPDFFVGAPYSDHPEINAGSLHIFTGAAGM